MQDNKIETVNIHNVLVDGSIVITKIRKTYVDGKIYSKEYLDDKDRLHRDSQSYRGIGPAVIRYKNDSVVYRAWYDHDKLHRSKGLPAVIEYTDDGKYVIDEKYYINNQLHRNDDFPAHIIYDPVTHKAIEKIWYVFNNIHRCTHMGPARILYTPDGKMRSKEFLVDGYRVIINPKIEELNDLIKDMGPEDIDKCIKLIKLLK